MTREEVLPEDLLSAIEDRGQRALDELSALDPYRLHVDLNAALEADLPGLIEDVRRLQDAVIQLERDKEALLSSLMRRGITSSYS